MGSEGAHEVTMGVAAGLGVLLHVAAMEGQVRLCHFIQASRAPKSWIFLASLLTDEEAKGSEKERDLGLWALPTTLWGPAQASVHCSQVCSQLRPGLSSGPGIHLGLGQPQ